MNMKSTEKGVLNKSEVYFFSPSQIARKIYFYAISAGHFYCEKGYHLIRNNYNSFLITHIISGTFTYVKNGRSVSAHEGDTVILNCYEPHEYYTDTTFESIWIHVGGSSSFELFNEIENSQGNLIKSADTMHIEKLLFRIFDALKSTLPSSEIQISIDIYKLFMDLLNPKKIPVKQCERYEESIDDLKNFISEHLSDTLTVKLLADKMNMSSSHFSRTFKLYTGYSPYEYILISRLNMAKNLLQKTDKSVGDIASEVGFNSESNFSFCFTENVGITPKKFRKLNF